MKGTLSSVIMGTGSYIPKKVVGTECFMDAGFFDDGILLEKTNAEITGIRERRYAGEGELSSTMGARAAQLALEDAGIE